jgi:hypothetical protein
MVNRPFVITPILGWELSAPLETGVSNYTKRKRFRYQFASISEEDKVRLARVLNLPISNLHKRNLGGKAEAFCLSFSEQASIHLDIDLLESMFTDQFTINWLRDFFLGYSHAIEIIDDALSGPFSSIAFGRSKYTLCPITDSLNLVFPVFIDTREVAKVPSKKNQRNIAWFLADELFPRSPYYENQLDFSELSRQPTKVFAYYLPQFHETLENDIWYGDGFTEWTSVKSAQMWWSNHYQRHIPHENFGFYRLDSVDELVRQSEDMRKANVDGLIFYHYWFSGKLMLENPSQLLLQNKDISIPFFFCWANENWTRKWDGNDNDVLLSHEYSLPDSEKFMEYLIPFFQDSRYIKVDGRPVLNIYRANLIPEIEAHLDVWDRVCKKHGVPKPYLISSRTRGVKSYEFYSMDAEVERVLFDWTDGKVESALDSLEVFPGYHGDVIDYGEVAEFYSKFNKGKSGPSRFRSIVPSWDNTARYGAFSNALSNASPKLFESWLSETLAEADLTGSPFVFINAWNEWAEGAHLEADLRDGYANLNSVGRATTGQIKVQNIDHSNPKIFIETGSRYTWGDSELWVRTFKCLEAALRDLGFDWELTIEGVDMPLPKGSLVLSVLAPCLFTSEALSNLIEAGRYSKVVSYSSTFSDSTIDAIESFRQVGPLMVQPDYSMPVKLSEVSVAENARVHLLFGEGGLHARRTVTAIIQFGPYSSVSELQRVILCLATQVGFSIQISVNAKELGFDKQREIWELQSWVEQILGLDICVNSTANLWGWGGYPKDSEYVHYLSTKDELFPFAYSQVAKSLEKNRKRISFIRFYSSSKATNSEAIMCRDHTSTFGLKRFDAARQIPNVAHGCFLKLSELRLGSEEYSSLPYLDSYQTASEVLPEADIDWESLFSKSFLGDRFNS